MLRQNHRRYTREALKGLRLGKEVRAEVLTGVSANDLCELTNEGQPFLREKAALESLFGAKEKLFGHVALWQSHFGSLASMHVMSKAPGEPAATTLAEVRAWFDFLNGVALGKISIDPHSTIGSDQTPIDGLFSDLHIEYEQLFDSDDLSQIRSRAFGMMLHLIQDSFTPCHCEREENLEIAEFYCYELQDARKHRDADDVATINKDHLVLQCAECARSVLLRREPYDYTSILSLRANPDNSSGGGY